jgi:hypothetical protein
MGLTRKKENGSWTVGFVDSVCKVKRKGERSIQGYRGADCKVHERRKDRREEVDGSFRKEEGREEQ